MTGVMKVSATVFAPGETVGAAELARAGLLLLGEQVTMDATAVFVPADAEGAVRRIEIGARARVGAYAVICGGTCTGENTQVEEHTIVGKPEKGYAAGHLYPGAGARTQISAGVVVRAGAVIYAGVQARAGTVIGHHTLLRSFVTVGEDTQLGHTPTVERAARIGHCVRCSPGSHITSSCVLADRVFLGAGVRTINDRELIWREAGRAPKLIPPRFERGAKVGSGSVVLAGVVIGENALVGAGSVVTRDVPAGATAYGVPARVRNRPRGRRGRRVDRPAGRGVARAWRAGPGVAAPLRHGAA